MKCLECNKEMISGYVHSNGAILWSEGSKETMVGGEEVLSPVSFFKAKKLSGFKCDECKSVTFKYD